MRQLLMMVTLGCMPSVAWAQAADSAHPAGSLPTVVVDRLRDGREDYSIVHVQKEIESDRECYLVSVVVNGQLREYYVSPEGNRILSKEQPDLVTEWNEKLVYLIALLLIPGACSWLFLRMCWRKEMPLLVEWSGTWFLTSCFLTILYFLLSNLRPKPDELGVILRCTTWGAVTASFTEAIALVVRRNRGTPTVRLRGIITFLLLGVFFIAATIPVEYFRTNRNNQILRAIALGRW